MTQESVADAGYGSGMTTDEPLWLDGEETDAWMALVGVLLTLPGALDSQLQHDSGMTFFEYSVMAGLSAEATQQLRMSDLAAFANGSLPRLSQVVSRLEAKGWVRRQRDPDDGRATLAVLTADGMRQMGAAAPGHVAAVRRLVFDQLTQAQVCQLRDITRSIKAALAPPGSLVAEL